VDKNKKCKWRGIETAWSSVENRGLGFNKNYARAELIRIVEKCVNERIKSI
jgi:hypothetical protein